MSLDVPLLTKSLNELHLEPNGISSPQDLSNAIKRTLNADALSALWKKYKEFFNPIASTAFLNMLWKNAPTNEHGGVLLTTVQARTLGKVLRHVERTIDQYEESSIRILCNALRHLKPENCRTFHVAKSELFRFDRHKLESYEGKSLAMIAEAASQLDDSQDTLRVAIAEELMRRDLLPTCDACSLAFIAKAFACSTELHQDLYRALIDHTIGNRRIREFEPWALVMFLNGCTQADAQTPQLVWACAKRCLNERHAFLSRLDGIELGQLKEALFTLPNPPTQLLELIKQELLSERIHRKMLALPSGILLKTGRNSFGHTDMPPHLLAKLLESVRLRLYNHQAKALKALQAHEITDAIAIFEKSNNAGVLRDLTNRLIERLAQNGLSKQEIRGLFSSKENGPYLVRLIVQLLIPERRSLLSNAATNHSDSPVDKMRAFVRLEEALLQYISNKNRLHTHEWNTLIEIMLIMSQRGRTSSPLFDRFFELLEEELPRIAQETTNGYAALFEAEAANREPAVCPQMATLELTSTNCDRLCGIYIAIPRTLLNRCGPHIHSLFEEFEAARQNDIPPKRIEEAEDPPRHVPCVNTLNLAYRSFYESSADK